MKRTRIILNSFVAIILVIGVIFGWRVTHKGPEKVTPTYATAFTGNISNSVSAQGTVVSNSDSNLTFGSSGKVTSVRVIIGQVVRTGQVLATIDDTAARQTVAQATGSLSSAKISQTNAQVALQKIQDGVDEKINQNTLDQAKYKLDQAQIAFDNWNSFHYGFAAKPEILYDYCQQVTGNPANNTKANSQIVSDCSTWLANYDSLTQAKISYKATQDSLAASTGKYADQNLALALEQLKNADANVANAQLSLEVANKALEGTKLIAPKSGVVAAVGGKIGDQVTANSVGNSGSTGWIVITSAAELQVKVNYAEADATKLNIGAPVNVTFDALPNVQVSGKLISLSPTPSSTGSVTAYGATISMNRVPNQVKVGMTAQASVILQGVSNVVVINSSAVTTTGSGSTVTVVTSAGKPDEKQEIRNVTIGIKGDTGTEIKSGLKAGEVVLIPTRNSLGSNGFPSSRFGSGATTGTLGGGSGGGGGRVGR